MPQRLVNTNTRLIVTLSALVFITAVFAVSAAFIFSAHTNNLVCHDVNHINFVIQQTLRRSLINLPKISYYQHRPAELMRQLKEIHREVKAFAPIHC